MEADGGNNDLNGSLRLTSQPGSPRPPQRRHDSTDLYQGTMSLLPAASDPTPFMFQHATPDLANLDGSSLSRSQPTAAHGASVRPLTAPVSSPHSPQQQRTGRDRYAYEAGPGNFSL
ncbi:MAG: hypothetical protein WDW38_002883 [Sanguina aurantia]